jgi:glycosyltransferase involved in cell wall biosynthesis
MSARLSICVPSRNRQVSFQETIRDLTANPRGDVEFVFADNSDDAMVMDAFIADFGDPRIRYLKSGDRPLSIQDNWDRAMAAATGDWIVFIGDDDYVDPDVIDTIAEIVARRPSVDALGWNRMSFKWPEYRPFRGNTCLSLGNSVTLADRDSQLRTMFLWEGAAPVPKVAFGAYHAAARRDVMERIRTTFCGRYFEHPTVDFDCSFKLLMTARELAYIDRPFSVLGTTSASNSAAVGRFDRVAEIHEEMAGPDVLSFEDPAFPFTSRLGVASSILAAQHWFKTKYGFRFGGWEENFVRALAIDCGHAEDKAGFDRHAAQCRKALAAWQGGRFLQAFNPRFVPRRNSGVYTGLRGQYLFIDETIAACRTPAELYSIAQSILGPPSRLNYQFDRRDTATEPMMSAA